MMTNTHRKLDSNPSQISLLGTSKSNTKKLGDGCYHVFLDLGANVGVHGRFLFEPEKYPDATVAHGVFDGQFGPPGQRDNRDFCVFAFEPNPAHKERHKELEASYAKMGWKYFPQPYAVSDLEGELTFYHQDNGKDNEWGFAAMPSGFKGRENTKEVIPTIRIARWLRENIEGRKIPIPHSTVKPPTVVMKFDVEGVEYSMMPDLMFSGVLCDTVDYAFGENHFASKYLVEFPPNPETGKGGMNPNIHVGEEADRYWKDLLYAFGSLRNDDCKTTVVRLDDETYHMDGMPLPA